MGTVDFGNAGVILAEPGRRLRDELQQVLVDLGFRRILATGNLLAVKKGLEEAAAHLLVGDTKLPEGDLSELVKQIRHSELGNDPFLVVITLVSNPTPALIRRVIDSGPDDVLVKPFEAVHLADRVNTLARGRKRFVVTTDYIGPDRRQVNRGSGMEVPLIDVPNPLLMAATGQLGSRIQSKSTQLALARVNVQKVERHAYQIGYLMDRIVPDLMAGAGVEVIGENLALLHKVAEDLSKRIRETPYRHVTEMCMTLANMAGEMKANGGGMANDNLMLMAKLTALIRRAFDTAESSQVTPDGIMNAVEREQGN